jgi:rhodanese-related sulfurtransferase
MSDTLRQAIREAGSILIAAAILGLSYTAITGKGFFAGRESANTGPTSATTDRPPRFITYDEAYQLFSTGRGLFLDARHEYDYKLGHIRGAVNVPLGEVENRGAFLGTLQRDSLLICYCDGIECNSSLALAKRLEKAGFTNIRIFFAGWKEWQTHQQQVEQ